LAITTPLVLLVDDDSDTRELYSLILDISGYRHAFADSVESAVETARRVRPDAVLTDWMLGDGDGITLCGALHRYGRTRRIPIVAATGMSLSPETRARARQLGCEMFLTKPVDIDALVRAIGCTLQVRQARSLRAAAVRLRRYARRVRDTARSAPTRTIASQLLAASRLRVSKSVALVLADDTGHYLAVNDRAAELTGYESHELITMSVADLTPEDGELQRPRLWSTFIDAGTQEGVYLVKRRDGLAVPMRYVAVANIAPGLHLSALALTDQPASHAG
jgi:PAS domain S-box-containing protein